MSVDPSDSANFTLRFNPGSSGIKTADVTIESNGMDIPNSSGSFSFDETLLFTSTQVEFIIENTGADASHFSVTTPPGASVAAGGNTAVTVSFNPTTADIKTAVVEIENSDLDEDPYTFNISGDADWYGESTVVSSSYTNNIWNIDMVVVEPNVYIVYSENGGAYDIKFAKSTDGGATWPVGWETLIKSSDIDFYSNSITTGNGILYSVDCAQVWRSTDAYDAEQDCIIAVGDDVYYSFVFPAGVAGIQ